MIQKIRIGTRASKLAIVQTMMTIEALKAVRPDIAIEIITLDTTGDKTQSQNISLQKIGGKGLFADSLNAAMDRDEVDIIVHSMKDLPSVRPDKYTIAAMLERGDARDSFLSSIPGVNTVTDLPQGAVIGTSAPRRAAVVLKMRPDLKTVTFRGNVDTRLQKLQSGFENVSATFLARVGLVRLGLENIPQTILSIDDFLPPAGQGAVGVEVLSSNKELVALINTINHAPTFRCVTAERACLAVVDGDCKTSIAAYAVEENDMMTLRTEIYTPDGTQMEKTSVTGSSSDFVVLGTQAGETLLEKIGAENYDAYHMCAPHNV